MRPARRPRVALDTYVVFSGILSRSGPPFEILHLWHARRFTLVLTEEVNREYHRVIVAARSSRKISFRGFDAILFLQLLAIDADWIEVDVAPMIRSRDPNDDKLLSAAFAGQTDFLVTGDNDLLDLAADPRLGSVRIVTPGDFLGALNSILD